MIWEGRAPLAEKREAIAARHWPPVVIKGDLDTVGMVKW